MTDREWIELTTEGVKGKDEETVDAGVEGGWSSNDDPYNKLFLVPQM